MFPTSSGTIFVYGKDIRTDQEVIRKNMGVCMQHNVLFNYLTTKEHLLLYGYIKVPHCSKQELYQEVKRYKSSRVGEGRGSCQSCCVVVPVPLQSLKSWVRGLVAAPA